MDNEQKKKKDIEVVQGNGTDIEISPVYSHIKLDESDKKTDKNKKIVIPKEKNK